MRTPDSLPAPWLLAALVLALWWPIRTFWQSDDWLAMHYASDLARALGDFTHNQYDLPGLVWFYRPLITLSFAFDYLLGGAGPFASHLSNALAHAISAMLVGMLAQRLLGGSAGWGAGLVWGAAPLHAGSVLWAVGRVDSHTTVWILLSAVLLVRWVDGRGGRWPAVLAGAAALCSKELAIVLPGVAAIVCFAAASEGRLRAAWRGTWPFVLLLGLWFALRVLVLGRALGGYDGGGLEPLALARGLATWSARIVNPLLVDDALVRARLEPELADAALPWIGYLPIALGVLALLWRRRFGLLAGALLAFVGCCLPTLQFWTATEHLQNLRYFTLPFAALALLIAGGGLWTALLALVVFAGPHWQVRQDYLAVFDASRNMHARLRELAADLPREPLFVAGLPAQNAKGNVVMFHLGVDRLLQPPFGNGRQRTFALRPLDPRPGVHALPHGEGEGLPDGRTLAFAGPDILVLVPPSPAPALEVAHDGPAKITAQVLWDWHEQRASASFTIRGRPASHYRITIFAAGGYLTAILPDEAPAGERDARVSLKAWLESRYAAAPHQLFVADALRTATTMDLEPRFPVLIEAGRPVATAAGEAFEVSHASRAFLWLEFERDYAEWFAGRR
jgi:hypothetical protein